LGENEHVQTFLKKVEADYAALKEQLTTEAGDHSARLLNQF